MVLRRLLFAVPLSLGLLALLWFRPWKKPEEPRAEMNPAVAPAAERRAPALPVDVFVVNPEELEVPVPATGTLLPREAVELVSELSLRLVKVRAQDGARVKKGQVLFELDGSQLSAELARLKVQEELARKVTERQEAMLQERVTTEAEAEAARAQVDEVKAQRNALAVTLSKTTIRAPFDGVLGLRRVSEGAWVSPSTVLITIQDTSQLKVDFKIPERFATSISSGGKFHVTVEGQAAPFEGEIVATEPSVDVASRSLTVRGILKDPGPLVPGAFARVELPVVVRDALLLPPLAVIPAAQGRSVFVERDGVAHLVPVELGPRTAERVQATSGLAPGDRVIVSNLLRLRDGAPVIVEKAGP